MTETISHDAIGNVLADLSAAQRGDHDAFERLIATRRRELHAHCYRMLGSLHDADDALQDALVRAWRALASVDGHGTLRSWLYTIATRCCLDLIERRSRRALPVDLGPAATSVDVDARPTTDIAWLEPYPGLPHISNGSGPEVLTERHESVELAYVAALQHLTGNQRAALILFEVVGLTAAEIADMMSTSVASVNSSLQRARRIVAEKIAVEHDEPAAEPAGTDLQRRRAHAFATALQHGDVDALTALLTEDVTWMMPPIPNWYSGIDTVTGFATKVPMGLCGSWKFVPIVANSSPGIAFYLRNAAGEPYRAWSITAFDFRDGRVRSITSFLEPDLFDAFGLPALLR